jgi:tetratricopeptide (TPR) repeat protein
MGLKAKVTEILRMGHVAEQAYLESFSKEEKALAGESGDWAPKDIVAHMTAWKDEVVSNYEAFRSGKTFPEPVHFEVRNEEFFEQNRDFSWEEVLEFHATTYQRMLEMLDGLSDAELASGGEMPYQGGAPFWRLIIGIAYSHPMSHLRDSFLARGEPAKALDLQEQAHKRLSELDDSEGWRGALQYNRACTYSLAGEHDKALGFLREALQIYPGLKDWSKKDPDLESLREHPDYDAIYATD